MESDAAPPTATSQPGPATSTQPLAEQIGGGRRLPSPPPLQTPTRLRSKLKATERDTGLVRDAGTRRGLLVDGVPTEEDQAPTTSGATVEALQDQRVECANVLFNGIPSQSPFLTCKMKLLDSDETEKTLGTVGSPSDDARVLASSSTQAVETMARAASAQPGRTFHVSRPRTVMPPLVNLKETLGSITAQRADGYNPQLARHADISGQVDDGANEDSTPQAPRAIHSPSTILDFEMNDYDFDAMELDIPDRPETPTPPSRGKHQSGSLLGTVDGTDDGVDVTALGRTPAHINIMLDEAFQQIYSDLSQLAERAGLPFQRVINRFTKQFGRTCTSNHWNTYQKFHAANKEEEMARLGQTDVTLSTPAQNMKQCYALFQEAYPETWQNILTTFDDAAYCNNHGSKSLAQRESLFFRLAKHHSQAFASIAKAHGFETAMIMAGGVINQDAALGVVYASPGAENFFLDRCRANHNEVLGHFKAHIYNRLSLTNVALAFDGLVAVEGSKDVKEGDGGDEPEIVEVGEMEDHAQVRSAFVQALTKLGCSWVSRKLFPWKGLPNKLSLSGIVCHNFPDAVPFPGERAKAGSKGICDLTLAECSILIASFNKPAKEGLYFEQKPNSIADLRACQLPVIVGAAPEPESQHSFGKRMFADCTLDRKGLPRPPNRAATRIKKKKTVAPSIEVISIPDSPDTVTRTKTKSEKVHQKTGLPSASNSTGNGEVSAPVEKRTLPLRKRRGTRAVQEVQDEVESVMDISSPSGSDFQPDEPRGEHHGGSVKKDDLEEETTSEGAPDSEVDGPLSPRKRKAKGQLSSRPSKKRVAVEVPRASYVKGKGKAPVRFLKKNRGQSSPVSSEDEAELPRTLSGHVGAVEGAVAVNTEREPALVPTMVQQPLACADSVKPPAQPERPKPRMVSKNTQRAIQDDADAFSLRKQPLQGPSASKSTDTGVSHPSVSSGGTRQHHEGSGSVSSRKDSIPQGSPKPPPQPPVIQQQQGDEGPGDPHDSRGHDQSTKAEGVAAIGPDAMTMQGKGSPPRSGGVPAVPPIVSRESGGQADTEHPEAPSNVAAAVEGMNLKNALPCPPGWPTGFGPPGSAGQFPGYLFPPFGAWGMFPGLDPKGTHPAAGSGDEQAAQQAATQAAYLAALLNFHGQQFPFPKPDAPPTGSTSSEAGNAAHGEGAGSSDAK